MVCTGLRVLSLSVEEGVGKSDFVSHTKHIAEATKYGSISFKIDNMHYVNFRI